MWLPLLACLINLWLLQEMEMTSGVLPEKAPAERTGWPAGKRAGPHTVIQTFHSEISFIKKYGCLCWPV